MACLESWGYFSALKCLRFMFFGAPLSKPSFRNLYSLLQVILTAPSRPMLRRVWCCMIPSHSIPPSLLQINRSPFGWTFGITWRFGKAAFSSPKNVANSRNDHRRGPKIMIQTVHNSGLANHSWTYHSFEHHPCVNNQKPWSNVDEQCCKVSGFEFLSYLSTIFFSKLIL